MVTVNTLKNFTSTEAACPDRWRSDLHMTQPSTTIILSVLSFLCLVFALVIGIRYNTVKVFNRRFYTRNTTINAMWIISYFLAGLMFSLLTVHHALRDEIVSPYDQAYFLMFYIFTGVQAFFLGETLNMQRKFKSAAPTSQTNPGIEDPLIPKTHVPTGVKFGFSDALIIVMMLAYISLLLFYSLRGPDTFAMSIAVIAMHGVQRAIVPLMSLIIIVTPNSQDRTVSTKSKIFLSIFAFFHLTSVLPLGFWTWLIPQKGCLVYIANATDIMIAPIMISYVFLFLFIRSEYVRNMEQCIWETVTQIQDNFDFRKFS